MIIKPKIIGGTTTGDYKVRFQYLTVDNSKLVNKIDTLYANAGGEVVAPTISNTISTITGQCPALSLESTSFPWNILTRVHVPSTNTNVFGVSINEATWKAYSTIVSFGAQEYKFTYNGTDWGLTENLFPGWGIIGTNEVISNYGLTITTGTPAVGDYFIVDYKNFKNIQSDLDVSAVYKPTDGKTTAYVSLNVGSGFVLPIYVKKSDTSTLTISWGDGSSDYTSTASGIVNTTHTYVGSGVYELKAWISSGSGTFILGDDSTNSFIGGSVQNYKDSLNRLFIGSKVTATGVNSSPSAYSLELVTVPNTVTTIGNSSFYNCRNLKNIYLSSGVTTIGQTTNVFQQCYNLAFLSLPTSTTTLSEAAFNNCKALTNMTIPNGITSLGAQCFNNSSLTKIKIPHSVTSVGNNCFSAAYNLTNFEIPKTMTTWGTTIFSYCYGFNSITIPSTITSIPASTFDNCSSLKSITLTRWTSPSTITALAATTAFSNTNSTFRIYVPVGSLSVYRGATNWSTYSMRMYEDTAQNRALFGD